MLAGASIHNIGYKHTRLRGVRAICAQHRASPFDLIQAIWSGSCSLVAVTAARLLHLPCVVHIAGGELASLPEIQYGGRSSWRGRVREAIVLHAASAVTAASTPVIASLFDLGIDGRRVPLGVDLDTWPPRAPVRRARDAPARLIHVASLNRVKDQGTLLRALSRLVDKSVDFHLDIVGEDTLGGEIQALAEHLSLTARVTFHGFLPQRLLRPLVEAAHLMIVSSRHEAGPLVMLEAAVAGIPTVGTAVGHVSEWAPEASRSVAVADWQGLARAIHELLDDEELRLQLARAAFRRALEEDATRTAEDFEALYAEILASRH
jgi:glycosyltransferase involved in cell wall biosynthesis